MHNQWTRPGVASLTEKEFAFTPCPLNYWKAVHQRKRVYVLEKLKRVAIKEELVALTKNTETAVILQQFVYWMERVKDYDKFIAEENRRRFENDEELLTLNRGWIYKTAKEMKEETMLSCSVKTVANKMAFLVEKQWLQRRTNPKYKWDKTYQYRVNLIKLCSDLAELGYCLEGYPFNEARNNPFVIVSTQRENIAERNAANYSAIPEITTDINSESTLNKGVPPIVENTALSFTEFRSEYSINEDEYEAIVYYLLCYDKQFRKCHPKLKAEQWEKVVDKILFCDEIGEDLEVEQIKAMIDQHFQTQYKNCDYNILHFLGDGVKKCRFYEKVYNKDLD